MCDSNIIPEVIQAEFEITLNDMNVVSICKATIGPGSMIHCLPPKKSGLEK